MDEKRKWDKYRIIAAVLIVLFICVLIFNLNVVPASISVIKKSITDETTLHIVEDYPQETTEEFASADWYTRDSNSNLLAQETDTTSDTESEIEESSALVDEENTQAQATTAEQETTQASTQAPTQKPTQAPTQKPTQRPTQAPTQKPTQKPTQAPTQQATVPVVESGTALENHGRLSVKGVNLVDSNGKPFQLKGVSTHGLAWFPQYVNLNAFKTIRDGWGANLVRLAMYTSEYGGYCSGGNKANLEKLVDDGVKYATQLGMYVIIDWHILNDRNPMTNIADAKVFWQKTSAKYANYSNVIYEICNEPNGCSWADVKKYADTIIPIIRANDKNAIIIVGTPTWSQDVDVVSSNPLKPENQKNVMYAVHFYAATHGDNIRNKVKTARAAGTPVFVSEFSICDASGNGGIDYNSANTWKKLINDLNLSYAGWSLCNKAETASLIKSSCAKLYGWTQSELSDTGKFLKEMCGGGNDNVNLDDLTQAPTQAPTQATTQAPTQATTQAPTQPPKTEMTYQFDVTVTNTSNQALDDWTINYNLSSGSSIFGSWCCDVSLSGNTLVVKPADYNRHIDAGGSVSGIGIQIVSKEQLGDFKVMGDGFEVTFHMGNSW